MKATQAEFNSLAKRYNEVRTLCDSYLTEIAELKQTIAKLETDLEASYEVIWNAATKSKSPITVVPIA